MSLRVADSRARDSHLWKKIGLKEKVPTLEGIGPKSLNKVAWEPGCKSHEPREIT